MKQETKKYIPSCHKCQLHEAKFRESTDAMITSEYSKEPFEVHMDFADLRKRSVRMKPRQAFLLCIDEWARMVAPRDGIEDANSAKTLLNH